MLVKRLKDGPISKWPGHDYTRVDLQGLLASGSIVYAIWMLSRRLDKMPEEERGGNYFLDFETFLGPHICSSGVHEISHRVSLTD